MVGKETDEFPPNELTKTTNMMNNSAVLQS